MIIVLKKGATQQDIDKLTNRVTAHGVQVNPVIGTELTILGLVGDTSQVDPNRIESGQPERGAGHARGRALQKGQPQVPPRGHGDRGGRGAAWAASRLAVMAGPCSVESREQITGIAQAVKQAGGQHPPGRRLQAPHLPLRLPGPEVRGAGAPVQPPGSHRPAHRHRDHVPLRPGGVRGGGGRDPGGRPEHAELRPAQASWAAPASPSCSSAASPPPSRSGS